MAHEQAAPVESIVQAFGCHASKHRMIPKSSCTAGMSMLASFYSSCQITELLHEIKCSCKTTSLHEMVDLTPGAPVKGILVLATLSPDQTDRQQSPIVDGCAAKSKATQVQCPAACCKCRVPFAASRSLPACPQPVWSLGIGCVGGHAATFSTSSMQLAMLQLARNVLHGDGIHETVTIAKKP